MTTEVQLIKKKKGLQSSNHFRKETTDKQLATGSTIYSKDIFCEPKKKKKKKLIDELESANRPVTL